MWLTVLHCICGAGHRRSGTRSTASWAPRGWSCLCQTPPETSGADFPGQSRRSTAGHDATVRLATWPPLLFSICKKRQSAPPVSNRAKCWGGLPKATSPCHCRSGSNDLHNHCFLRQETENGSCCDQQAGRRKQPTQPLHGPGKLMNTQAAKVTSQQEFTGKTIPYTRECIP